MDELNRSILNLKKLSQILVILIKNNISNSNRICWDTELTRYLKIPEIVERAGLTSLKFPEVFIDDTPFYEGSSRPAIWKQKIIIYDINTVYYYSKDNETFRPFKRYTDGKQVYIMFKDQTDVNPPVKMFIDDHWMIESQFKE